MSRLPRISSRDLIKFLTEIRGFSYVHTRGSHHIYGTNERRISVPERNEIGTGLLLAILAEAGSSREEFMEWWNS